MRPAARVWLVPILVLMVAACAAADLRFGPLPWREVQAPLLSLRAGRCAAGLVVGACLAVAGLLMQGLFRNPLASPSITGVSAGANLGILVMLLLGAAGSATSLGADLGDLPDATRLGDWALPLGSTAGALLALGALLAAARRLGGDLTAVLLIGLVLSIFLAALASILLAWSTDSYALARAMIAFSLGSLDQASWSGVALALPLLAGGLIAAWCWSPTLDVLLSGEDEARALGVDLVSARRWLFAWTALLTAAAAMLGGGVGFVCLVVPNALRPVLGARHRPLVAACALAGGGFVAGADLLARACSTGHGELPLGAVTGLIGAPFLIWHVRTDRRRLQA